MSEYSLQPRFSSYVRKLVLRGPPQRGLLIRVSVSRVKSCFFGIYGNFSSYKVLLVWMRVCGMPKWACAILGRATARNIRTTRKYPSAKHDTETSN